MLGLLTMLDGMITDYDEDSVTLLRYQLATNYIDKDKVLCKEGEDLAAAFYVVGGQVTLSMQSPGACRCALSWIDGESKIVARLGPGAVVGNELLVNGNTSMFTITTTAPSLLWSLSREAFQTYLTVCPPAVTHL